ncbi:hypothetical protein O6H91_15G062600 [Diphasiastrum complanatum]|nr:hypothetical protein O6H91_15G062600 [Diphasiastrum complanatum]
MRDRIEGTDSRSSMSNCMHWLGLEKDQCAEACYSRGISALSNLNLGLGNASGRDASSARISTPSRLIPQFGMDTESHALPQSAPMNVPNWSKILGSEEKAFRGLQNAVTAQDEDEDDERLPPHELLARECAKSQAPTFSVYEGVGRTLKGRDLDRVRNAVLRKTGFIDV